MMVLRLLVPVVGQDSFSQVGHAFGAVHVLPLAGEVSGGHALAGEAAVGPDARVQRVLHLNTPSDWSQAQGATAVITGPPAAAPVVITGPSFAPMLAA